MNIPQTSHKLKNTVSYNICSTLFIMNIVFPESGMQLESNLDDEGNGNIDLMCITLFGKLFRDLH